LKNLGADKQKGLILYWMLPCKKNNIIFCHGEVFFLDRGLLMGAFMNTFNYIYHKNEKGKPCEMDLPLWKNDITRNFLK